MSAAPPGYPPFDRHFLTSGAEFSVIGPGELGGKATGLAAIRRFLGECVPDGALPGIQVRIPRLTVLATGIFEQFIELNNLHAYATTDEPDDRIAHAFLKAELPPLVLGDLQALAADQHTPLAIRSSSRLEDALRDPFAGTYATKMIPNNQPDATTRFARLVEAIKFVYASTFFRDARSYMRAIGQRPADERMAVIIQEVAGQTHGERFYPTVSGVIRTHNFYPLAPARPEDGMTNLALGLGKTIVDGGVCWTYTPRYPGQVPPFGSIGDWLRNTQTEFWAVNMGPPPPYDPVSEDEYLVRGTLAEAEYDGVLRGLASTYDAGSDRLVLGTGRSGPRVLTFAPLLELPDVPLNAAVERLAACCRDACRADVEIEFALTLDRAQGVPAQLGFLQLRPMLVSQDCVDVGDDELRGPQTLLASERVLGNGVFDDLCDVVYVPPERFAPEKTPAIAAELHELNAALVEEGRTYVLIGFGRWGSSDRWLGIPVTWPQISGARVIVEATRPDMNVEPSQGTHFFHNMTSFRVQYFMVHHAGAHAIDWAWLAQQAVLRETPHVRHVRLARPLLAKVDGRTGRGAVLRGP